MHSGPAIPCCACGTTSKTAACKQNLPQLLELVLGDVLVVAPQLRQDVALSYVDLYVPSGQPIKALVKES